MTWAVIIDVFSGMLTRFGAGAAANSTTRWLLSQS